MPHLRYLQLAGNPIMKLTNSSFQGAMEHLQELDIQHVTLNYLEVKKLILLPGARVPLLVHRRLGMQACMTTVSAALLPWKAALSFCTRYPYCNQNITSIM
jgi:hypothetical protein